MVEEEAPTQGSGSASATASGRPAPRAPQRWSRHAAVPKFAPVLDGDGGPVFGEKDQHTLAKLRDKAAKVALHRQLTAGPPLPPKEEAVVEPAGQAARPPSGASSSSAVTVVAPETAEEELDNALALRLSGLTLTDDELDCGGLQRMGDVLRLLDAVTSQETAIAPIKASRAFVWVLAFTYDRADITQALLEAKRRRCDVKVGSDTSWALGTKAKEQGPRLKQLVAGGVEVRVLNGRSYSGEYKAVGRSPKGGLGMSHAKVIYADGGLAPEAGCCAVIGSCNWTTSSRANNEVGVLVRLDPQAAEELGGRIRAFMEKGRDFREAGAQRAQNAAGVER